MRSTNTQRYTVSQRKFDLHPRPRLDHYHMAWFLNVLYDSVLWLDYLLIYRFWWEWPPGGPFTVEIRQKISREWHHHLPVYGSYLKLTYLLLGKASNSSTSSQVCMILACLIWYNNSVCFVVGRKSKSPVMKGFIYILGQIKWKVSLEALLLCYMILMYINRLTCVLSSHVCFTVISCTTLLSCFACDGLIITLFSINWKITHEIVIILHHEVILDIIIEIQLDYLHSMNVQI